MDIHFPLTPFLRTARLRPVYALSCSACCRAMLAQMIAPSIRNRSSLGSDLSILASSLELFSGVLLISAVWGFMRVTYNKNHPERGGFYYVSFL